MSSSDPTDCLREFAIATLTTLVKIVSLLGRYVTASGGSGRWPRAGNLQNARLCLESRSDEEITSTCRLRATFKRLDNTCGASDPSPGFQGRATVSDDQAVSQRP